MASSKRLLPTGECWCVCRVEKAIGSFCLPGREEVVEAAVMYVGYNATPPVLDAVWLWTGMRESQP